MEVAPIKMPIKLLACRLLSILKSTSFHNYNNGTEVPQLAVENIEV
jgi:hypothetical protein